MNILNDWLLDMIIWEEVTNLNEDDKIADISSRQKDDSTRDGNSN